MSALLQGLAIDGFVPASSGGSAPAYVKNGIPFDADGTVACDSGLISHYHQGLPFTAQGRLAVDAGPVAYYGSGGAPFSATGYLALGYGADHVASGVPYDFDNVIGTSGDAISTDGVRITQQPVNWSGLEGATATFTVVATSGNGSGLSYQWQENITGTWTNLANAGRVSGVNTATLTVTSVVVADNNRRFRVNVTNSFNTRSSVEARILISGATWFILDEAGNRLIDEPATANIVDERSP